MEEQNTERARWDPLAWKYSFHYEPLISGRWSLGKYSYLEFKAKLWDNFQAKEWKAGGEEWNSLGLGGHCGYHRNPFKKEAIQWEDSCWWFARAKTEQNEDSELKLRTPEEGCIRLGHSSLPLPKDATFPHQRVVFTLEFRTCIFCDLS